jgi:hypothetical protein
MVPNKVKYSFTDNLKGKRRYGRAVAYMEQMTIA